MGMSRDRPFAEICKLHRSGMGKEKIARTLGVSKNTVRIATWFRDLIGSV
jgi:transposase